MPSKEFEGLLEVLRAQPELEEQTVEAWRQVMEASAGLLPAPDDVRYLPVDAEGVSCEWVTPPEREGDRTILYFHGGGYVLGSLDTHRHLVGLLAKAAKARVLNVNYRLGPEQPFPGAVEDGQQTYRWLLNQGVPPEAVVIAGDSAGGGLTIATLVALRDDGQLLPAAGVCISPWIDLEGKGKSMKERADQDPIVNYEVLKMLADWYLGEGDAHHPLASPLYADLTGLPPLLIHVGTAETLLDDSTRLAKLAEDSGVEVTLDIWEDMVHVWHYYAPIIPEGREAIAKIGEYVAAKTS